MSQFYLKYDAHDIESENGSKKTERERRDQSSLIFYRHHLTQMKFSKSFSNNWMKV